MVVRSFHSTLWLHAFLGFIGNRYLIGRIQTEKSLEYGSEHGIDEAVPRISIVIYNATLVSLLT